MASQLAKNRARAAGIGSNEQAVKYLNQDFDLLRSQYLGAGRLFVDETFPAAPESLGFKELGANSSKTRGVVWKRPKVLAAKEAPIQQFSLPPALLLSSGPSSPIWFVTLYD
ncbi:CAN2 protein, partial [Polypterus senegalus]